MNNPADARILIVDDVPTNLDVLFQALESESYQVLVATSGEGALKVAATERPDLVLLDVMMPGIDGFETCRRLKAGADTRDIPVIFLTSRDETEGVVEGFHVGGVDYIVKPFRKEEVLARLRTHLQNAFLARALADRNRELEVANRKLEREIAARQRLDSRLSLISRQEADRWGVEGFIGESRTLQKILQNIRMLRNADTVSVLITGESGTGKELIARAIHSGSSRSGGPFVAINCAAIPTQLAESMLFGHLKGAFTGADRDQIGCFDLADGGTLFLDEIGIMPAELQPKLLRVLEDGLIRPLGANADKKVNVRIVAATNAPDAFRDDLYFRLARFTVELPPLRRRREDIPLLARHFLKLFASEMGIDPPDLTREALERLDAHDFPGNVRELKNIVERALIESGGRAIGPEHLQLRSRTAAPAAPAAIETSVGDLPMDLAGAERALIERALKQAGGNVSAAARLLGIDRNKIYRKLGRHRNP